MSNKNILTSTNKDDFYCPPPQKKNLCLHQQDFKMYNFGLKSKNLTLSDITKGPSFTSSRDASPMESSCWNSLEFEILHWRSNWNLVSTLHQHGHHRGVILVLYLLSASSELKKQGGKWHQKICPLVADKMTTTEIGHKATGYQESYWCLDVQNAGKTVLPHLDTMRLYWLHLIDGSFAVVFSFSKLVKRSQKVLCGFSAKGGCKQRAIPDQKVAHETRLVGPWVFWRTRWERCGEEEEEEKNDRHRDERDGERAVGFP